MLVVLLIVAACDRGDAEHGEHGAYPDTVALVFTRDEAPVTVTRAVPAGTPAVRIALETLLRGPDETERAQGLRSWFSPATAGLLHGVTIDAAGGVVVDFADLRPVIPGASSAAGSQMLLHELNGTLFALPEVTSVEYRIDGSCARFWEWLQRECAVVRRP